MRLLGLGLVALACGGGEGGDGAERALAQRGGSGGAGTAGESSGGSSAGASPAGAGGSSAGADGAEPHRCELEAPRTGLYVASEVEFLAGDCSPGLTRGCSSEIRNSEPVISAGVDVADTCTGLDAYTWTDEADPSTPIWNIETTPECTLETHFRCPRNAEGLWPENVVESCDGDDAPTETEYRFRTFATGPSGDRLYGEVAITALRADGSTFCSASYGLRLERCMPGWLECE